MEKIFDLQKFLFDTEGIKVQTAGVMSITGKNNTYEIHVRVMELDFPNKLQ